MSGLRFSLAGLIGATVVVATGCAVLRFASALWASVVFTLAFGMLLLALVGALCGQRAVRPFWAGFAVFGWAYFFAAFNLWFLAGTSAHLLTTALLTRLQASLEPSPLAIGDRIEVQWGSSWWRCTLLQTKDGQYLIHYDGYQSTSDEWVPRTRIRPGEPEHFYRIGHALFAVLFGFVGGVLSQCLFAPGPAEKNRTAAPPPDEPRTL